MNLSAQWKTRLTRAGKLTDTRDALMLVGLILVWYGLNTICAGLGPAAVGVYLLLIATIRR